MDATEPIANRTLTMQAFDALRADILRGALRPSERLRIQALSEQYGVGATAIREALSRLVADSLVDTEDQRGFCVAPVSRDELLDLTRTRIDIETLALRKAIERGGVEWESQLVSASHRLAKTPPPDRPERHDPWADAHRQFHEALVVGCGSPWLLRLCRLLYDKTERYRNLAEHRDESSQRDTVVEHRSILQAAMDKRAARACSLLAAHFEQTTEIILRSDFVGLDAAMPSPRAIRTRP